MIESSHISEAELTATKSEADTQEAEAVIPENETPLQIAKRLGMSEQIIKDLEQIEADEALAREVGQLRKPR